VLRKNGFLRGKSISRSVISRPDHALDLGLIRANKIRLLVEPRMISKLDETDGFFKALIAKMGIDLGGRHLPVAQGSLNQSQVSGHAVEARGEGVAQRVDRGLAHNAGGLHPVADAVLDLPGAQPPTRAGLEEGRCAADSISFDMRGEDSLQRSIDEDRLGSAAFGSDINRALFEIDIGCVEAHQGSQADSRSQKQRDNGEISLGKWFTRLRNGIKQGSAFRIQEGGRRLPLTRFRFDEPGWIAVDHPRFLKISEEGPDGRLKAVERNGASVLALHGDQSGVRCEELSNIAWGDGFNVFDPADPVHKKPELPHVGSDGMRTPAVGPKLGLETLNGFINSHDAPPILDIPSYIHGLTRWIVKFIMRTSGELIAGISAGKTSHNPHKRPISAPCGPILLIGGM